MSFCCAGTRPSRRSAHTRRIYVGRRRMRSTTSAMSFGARMRLANTNIPLRKTCPERAQRLSEGCISIRGPERDEILRFAIRHAAQLERRGRFGRYPVGLREGSADLLCRYRLLVGRQNEHSGCSPRWKTRQVRDCRRHEGSVWHDHLTAVLSVELRRSERDSLDCSRVAGDLDAVADPERTLDEDPDACEEVLENVLGRQPDDDAHDTEGSQDPCEGTLGVDRQNEQSTDRDHRQLSEIADEYRDIRLRAVAGQGAHRHAAHSPRDQQGDRRDDERPEGPRTVIEKVVADDGRIERHPPENTSALDN